MSRQRIVTDSVIIDVDPHTAYAAVSDITQMGRWSPENLGGEVTDGAPVTIGTRFVGRNRRGRAEWVTAAKVIAADPGEQFAFRVNGIGVKNPTLRGRNATWEYRFEPVEGGTRVTETWTDDRNWPDAVAGVVDRVLTGGQPFAKFQEKNIRRTLERLKVELEAQR